MSERNLCKMFKVFADNSMNLYITVIRVRSLNYRLFSFCGIFFGDRPNAHILISFFVGNLYPYCIII